MRRKLNVKLVAGTLAGLLIFGAAGYGLHEYQLRQNAYRLLERGDRALEAKNYEKAEVSYAQYLSFVPNDADTVQKYAQVLDRRADDGADFVRLVVLMEQVLRVKPNQDELRVRLVNHLIALDRVPEAIAHLNRLLATAKDPAEVQHMLGWCHEARKDYGAAVQAFEKAVQLKPRQIKSYALLVEVLQDRLQQSADALKVLDEMVQANADAYEAYLLRGRFQRRQGDDEAAERDLRKAYQLKPEEPAVILELADAARSRRQWEEATNLLKEGLKRNPKHVELSRALASGAAQAWAFARWLEAQLQRREFSNAETELAKYEETLPLTPELARLGAEIALGMGGQQAGKLAVQRAAVAVTLPSRDYRDYLWLAPIHRAAGDNAQAEKLLRESLDLAGHTPDAWIAWMDHLALTSQHSLAAAEFERLKKELPADRQPLTLARCYDALHLLDRAAKAYDDALKARPDDLAVMAYAADFHRRADQTVPAQKLYERLLDPALAAPVEYVVKARRQLAIMLANRGDAERQQALALLNDNPKNRGDAVADQRIRLFIQSHDERARSGAINKFQETLQRQPPTPDERLLLAQMQEAAGNLDRARTQLSEVVNEYPGQPHFLVRNVQLLLRTGELDEASRFIARLETLEPNSVRVRELKTALARAQN